MSEDERTHSPRTTEPAYQYEGEAKQPLQLMRNWFTLGITDRTWDLSCYWHRTAGIRSSSEQHVTFRFIPHRKYTASSSVMLFTLKNSSLRCEANCTMLNLVSADTTLLYTANIEQNPQHGPSVAYRTKLRGLSRRANYTDRATAACRRS
jgi:hypothetical protein